MWREITLDNLNPPVFFLGQTPESVIPMALPVFSTPSSYGQRTLGAINSPDLIFTPRCTELLRLVGYKTDEQRNLLMHGMKDVSLITLENRYPSKSVTNFHNYPEPPRPVIKWKKEKHLTNHNSSHY